MSIATPLHALHVELGAKIVDFAGWQLPVSYPSGLMAEHAAARTGAALFDVSHMAQVELRGDDPAGALEALVPGGIRSLGTGKARYTFFTNETGGLLDDLIVSQAGDHLYLVVNAARADHDIPYMTDNLPEVTVTRRQDLALLALQGPKAGGILAALLPEVAEMTFMDTRAVVLDGTAARLSRLGYTGEDGFEVSLPAEAAIPLARRLIDAGATPAGLGARDSLRMEAGLPLYGQDIDETTNPVAAGLAWAIPKRRREAGDFPGAAIINAALADGPGRRFTGILPDGRAPARAGTQISAPDGSAIGHITSGGFSPTLGRPISMGYVAAAHADPDCRVQLLVRGKPQPARTVSLPFVAHTYQRS